MKISPKYLTAALLFLALAPWPYEYYMLLRIVVFFVFGYYAVQHWKTFEEAKKEAAWWVWGLGLMAILFNPFIPVRLTREIWMIFDIAAALLLLATISWAKGTSLMGQLKSFFWLSGTQTILICLVIILILITVFVST